jgi:hypothetical protein
LAKIRLQGAEHVVAAGVLERHFVQHKARRGGRAPALCLIDAGPLSAPTAKQLSHVLELLHNKAKAPGATGEVVLVPATAQSVQALAVGQMRSVRPIPPFLDKARASLARNT